MEHAPLVGCLGTTGCAHPLLVSLLSPKGTSSAQALNSAGHSCGTNTGCIFTPCWGIPAHLSWVQVAQSVAQSMVHPNCPANCTAHGTALLCPQSLSGPQPPGQGCAPAQEGLPLHLPLGCGSDVLSPGVLMQVMPSSRVTSLCCLLLLLRCLTCSGLTGSARCPRNQGHRLAPSWHYSRGQSWSWPPLPTSSPPLLSLRARNQRYLSRMRKSITMRTMGRKMRSRLSISAASSSASSRR